MEYHEQLFLYIWPISETNFSKDKYYHSSLKEEVHNLNSPIYVKEIEFIIKNLPTKKPSDLEYFTGVFYQMKKQYQFYTNCSRK